MFIIKQVSSIEWVHPQKVRYSTEKELAILLYRIIAIPSQENKHAMAHKIIMTYNRLSLARVCMLHWKYTIKSEIRVYNLHSTS